MDDLSQTPKMLMGPEWGMYKLASPIHVILRIHSTVKLDVYACKSVALLSRSGYGFIDSFVVDESSKKINWPLFLVPLRHQLRGI